MSVTDPQARARSLQSLVDRSLIEGQVELGTLSDIDECVLGEDRWVMAAADVWPRWLTVPADVRKAAFEETLASLAKRRMVLGWETPPGRRLLVPSGELALIVQARTAPGFVITFLEQASRNLPVCPVAYALRDDDGLQGYVVEIRAPDRHDYQLVTPARCVRGLARYAFNAVLGTLPSLTPGPLTLAIISGPSWAGAQLRTVRIEESRTIGLQVADAATGTAIDCFTEEDISDAITTIVTGIDKVVSAGDPQMPVGSTEDQLDSTERIYR